MPKVCERCGKDFLARPTTKQFPRPSRFCSQECAGNKPGTAMRGMRFDRKHPLASKSGRVLKYRATLYDAIGAGAHPCHWCSKPVTWTVESSRGRETKADLVVDHLDGDPRNNDPGNLVPACSRCNVLRGLLNAWMDITGKSPELLVNANR